MDGFDWRWTGARRDDAVLRVPLTLILLVAVLAFVAIGLGPTAAQVCGALQDFPCGP
jgi:hypothetical protein